MPKALSRLFDVDKTVKGACPRPGELRDHVFDLEDQIRCIISLDYTGTDDPVLHVSCSSTLETGLSFTAFLAKCSSLHTELWPDVLLVEIHRTVTERAIHFFYEAPERFLALCKQSKQ